MTERPRPDPAIPSGDAPGTNWRDEAMPDHETRPERDSGGGIVGEGWTATDAGTSGGGDADRVDPDGFPAAEFDRRTMEAEGGEAERDDDTDDERTIGLPSR